MERDHSVVVAAKDQKERDVEHKWSEILAREREKRDRIVGVERTQHLLDLDNCRRNSQRQWQSECKRLQKELEQLQKQYVGLEMREVRRKKSAEVQEEDYRLVVQSLSTAETVRARLNLLLGF
jgi:CRISPR/Cas system-associated endonuclease Cas3-HD